MLWDIAIPRNDPAGLGIVLVQGMEFGGRWSTGEQGRVEVHRGTSLIRNGDPPQDHQRALGIVLLYCPRGAAERGHAMLSDIAFPRNDPAGKGYRGTLLIRNRPPP